jgi:HPr kinase/phosphorylase
MIVHASCVAVAPRNGLLILGASGRGKSSLALMMMSLGATLVADDRTMLTRATPEGDLMARAPASIQNMIEARGVGLLCANSMEQCVIRAAVDLDEVEEERLPPARIRRLLECDIPVYHRSDGPHFAAALIQLLKGGRCA